LSAPTPPLADNPLIGVLEEALESDLSTVPLAMNKLPPPEATSVPPAPFITLTPPLAASTE